MQFTKLAGTEVLQGVGGGGGPAGRPRGGGSSDQCLLLGRCSSEEPIGEAGASPSARAKICTGEAPVSLNTELDIVQAHPLPVPAQYRIALPNTEDYFEYCDHV